MQLGVPPKTRVVVVDDSRTIQAMLEQLFTSGMNCEVVGVASSAQEGLDLLASLYPHVVTVDLAMPDIDGFELLTRLQASTSIYKVVVASNLDSDVLLRRRVKKLGADVLIDKRSIMSNPEGFRAKIRSMLETPKPARQTTPGDAMHVVLPVVGEQNPIILSYPVPVDESERLRSLRLLELANAIRENQFDLVTSHLCSVTDFPICLLTFIDRDTQWVKSAYGLAIDQSPRPYAFCNYTICGDDVFVVPNALSDDRFATNPSVTGEPGVRAYFGHPILGPTGARIGALCLIDVRPRQASANVLQNLKGMAAIVASMISSRAANIRVDAAVGWHPERDATADFGYPG